jgi:CheY-like chemotaxis protein
MPLRILIVENHPDSRQLMGYLLENFGYQVELAANGEMGIELALREEFDLILCDVRMPGTDGYEVARRLRADPLRCKTPLVAVTALTWHGNHEHVAAAGFDGYVSKATAPQQFIRQVQEFLSKWQK